MESMLDLLQSLRAKAGFLREEKVGCTAKGHGEYLAHVVMRPEEPNIERALPCRKCVEEKERQDFLERTRKWQEENRKARIDRAFERAAIPERFASRRLDTYVAGNDRQQRVLDFCQLYAARFDEVMKTGRSMILCGMAGTGKTHLSVGIAHEIMANGYTALYATVSGAVRRVRSTWGASGESEMEAIRMFTEPDLLILDEVGIQSGSDNEHSIIFDILNGRYERTRPTILLSNLPVFDVRNDAGVVTVRGIESYIGARLLDRMREGGGKTFDFDWPSHRGLV